MSRQLYICVKLLFKFISFFLQRIGGCKSILQIIEIFIFKESNYYNSYLIRIYVNYYYYYS